MQTAAREVRRAQTTTSWNKRARVTLLLEQFELNKIEGPYFPLARFGRYFITVKDTSGKVTSFPIREGFPAEQPPARGIADAVLEICPQKRLRGALGA